MEAAKDIISANVVVDAVAFSEDADSKLSYLASQTGIKILWIISTVVDQTFYL